MLLIVITSFNLNNLEFIFIKNYKTVTNCATNKMNITGVHINYYFLCKRKLWLFANLMQCVAQIINLCYTIYNIQVATQIYNVLHK